MPRQVRDDLRALELGHDRDVGALVVQELAGPPGCRRRSARTRPRRSPRLLDAEEQVRPRPSRPGTTPGPAAAGRTRPCGRTRPARRRSGTRTSPSSTFSTTSWIMPSSIHTWSPGRSAARYSGWFSELAGGGALHGAGGQHEVLARRERGLPAHERTEAHLGPLQILEDRDRPAPARLPTRGSRGSPRRARRGCRARSSAGPRPCPRPPADRASSSAVARRADRADDLRASQPSTPSGSSAAGAQKWPPHSPSGGQPLPGIIRRSASGRGTGRCTTSPAGPPPRACRWR